jgi:heptosyltransferase-1
LTELASLISASKFVVGVDTGLTHLGVALGRPAVGLFVCTDPAYTGLHGDTKHRNIGGPASPPTVEDALSALMAVI